MSLGTLYGADIVSIDYNLQLGNSASTATITLINTFGNYSAVNDSILGSPVRLPIFDVTMLVTEYKIVEGSESTQVQLELIDYSITIFDDILLVTREYEPRGGGTSLEYVSTAFEAVARDYIPSTATNKTSFPNFSGPKWKESSTYKNLFYIGRIRSIFMPSKPIYWYKTNQEGFLIPNGYSPQAVQKVESLLMIVFEDGTLNNDLSNFGEIPSASQPTEAQWQRIVKANADDVSIEYGITLLDLKNFLRYLGISLIDPSGIFTDEQILLKTSGTLREVLTNAASVFGFAFFMNFKSRTITIIDNARIAQINNSINSIGTPSSTTRRVESSSLVGKESKSIIYRASKAPMTAQESRFRMNDNGKSYPFKMVDLRPIVGKLGPQAVNNFTIIAERFFNVWQLIQDNEELFNLLVIDAIIRGQIEAGDLSDLYTFGSDGDVDLAYEAVVIDSLPEELKAQGKAGFGFIGGSTAISRIYGKAQSKKTAIKFPSETPLFAAYKSIFNFLNRIYISPRIGGEKAQKIAFTSDLQIYGPYVGNTLIKNTELKSLITMLQTLANTTVDYDITVKQLYEAAWGTINADDNEEGAVKAYYIAIAPFDTNTDDILGSNFLSSITDSLAIFTDDAGQLFCKKGEAILPEKELNQYYDTNPKKYRKVFYSHKNDENGDSASGGSGGTDQDDDKVETQLYKIIPYINNDSINSSNFNRRVLGRTIELSEINMNEINLKQIENYGYTLQAPIKTVELELFRLPTASELNIENGLDSCTIQVNENGIRTNLKYSTKKFIEFNQSTVKELYKTENGRRYYRSKVINKLPSIDKLNAKQKRFLGI